MRALIAASLILFSVGCSKLPSPIDNLQASTVNLAISFPTTMDRWGNVQNPKGIGSGFFVNSMGTIITARHCVLNSTKIMVMAQDGKSYQAEIVATSFLDDLALIQIHKANTPFLPIASQPSVIGEEVYTSGSPLGEVGIVLKGYVAKLCGNEDILNISILPGCSGSAVVNRRGEVIGVVSKLLLYNLGTTNLSLVVNADSIQFFLSEYGYGTQR